MTENFQKLMSDTKTTDPGSSENIKQDKYFKNKHKPRHIIFKLQKNQRYRKKSLKKPEGKNTLPVEEHVIKTTSNFSETI